MNKNWMTTHGGVSNNHRERAGHATHSSNKSDMGPGLNYQFRKAIESMAILTHSNVAQRSGGHVACIVHQR